MGIAGSTDIFQEKMLELMESIEFVKAYLDDLPCISKLSLEDHLDKLEVVLWQLCDTGLKVHAAKLTFCALEIEYLGFVLTRDGIKPQSNKVCWVRRRYCLAGITKLGERVAKNTKLE